VVLIPTSPLLATVLILMGRWPKLFCK
jgi:hypothetical protein